MIIDEYGEGYPVLWCLSNREDQILLIHYFEQLKKKTRTISPNGLCLMTLMGSIMHGYQYSIDIHKKSYVHCM